MTWKIKLGLLGLMVIAGNEVLTWAILAVLFITSAWPIIKKGVTLDARE